MAGKKKRRKKPSGSYLSPGVYVEEVPSGSKPIEGVGTAVAAFVGFAQRHPVRTFVAVAALSAALAAGLRAAHAIVPKRADPLGGR